MSDVFSKAKRSEIMASIRGKGNRSTERRLRARIVAAGISGWKLHPTNIEGKPDFAFEKERVAIFVDGCFWHGCKCKTIPESNREFWVTKIHKNMDRDESINLKLQEAGWVVLRFWEHELRKNPQEALETLRRTLGIVDSYGKCTTEIPNRSTAND